MDSTATAFTLAADREQSTNTFLPNTQTHIRNFAEEFDPVHRLF
jgi:hypothetical protein